MKRRFLGQTLLAIGLLVGTGAAQAADKTSKPPVILTDSELANKVRHELVMYSRYTIWDDVSFRVNGGQIELMGQVTQPYKKSEIENIVRDIPGVQGVVSDIRVLPLSDFDNRLRVQVARAIYNDPAFTRYATMALPPVHIIVDNGHVTLTGVVATDFEKNLAGMRANRAGLSFSVQNDLKVEQPAGKS